MFLLYCACMVYAEYLTIMYLLFHQPKKYIFEYYHGYVLMDFRSKQISECVDYLLPEVLLE